MVMNAILRTNIFWITREWGGLTLTLRQSCELYPAKYFSHPITSYCRCFFSLPGNSFNGIQLRQLSRQVSSETLWTLRTTLGTKTFQSSAAHWWGRAELCIYTDDVISSGSGKNDSKSQSICSRLFPKAKYQIWACLLCIPLRDLFRSLVELSGVGYFKRNNKGTHTVQQKKILL